MSKNIGILYRLSHSCPMIIIKRLYDSLILPYMNYCNIIWGSAARVHLNKILMLQKRAVRIITKSNYLQHTDPLFVQLGFLRIDEIYRYNCCIFVFKNLSMFDRDVNVYRTRRDSHVSVVFQRLSLCQRSIYFKVASLYNELPADVVAATKMNTFKLKVKEIILNSRQ